MLVFLLHLGALVLLHFFPSALGVCLKGCSCTQERFGRSLVCMESSLGSIPPNIPPDLFKIRIENSHLREIPLRAFYNLSALESLWLNFNHITLIHMRSLEGLSNLTELHLEGNSLTLVPWTAFQETPKLKILYLKHNLLDMLPESALHHLPALTYLDLSFNQLTVVSPDVFLSWPRHHPQKHDRIEMGGTGVVLALHENPWLCDCRLRGFVDFVRSIGSPIILMNSYLRCLGPKSRTGKFFHELELKGCMKPETFTLDTNVTVPLGMNMTLMCFVKARPDAVIQWNYALKAIRRFTVSQSQLDDETISSTLIIPLVHSADRGTYICSANNFIGNSSVSIHLNVSTAQSSFLMPPSYPSSSVSENVYIDIRIVKQTMYGIAVEWQAAIENPSETWFTVHFGRYNTHQKETLFVSPGVNRYSVNDLQPATKYEVCVSLKNQTPRPEQCIVFVTGSSTNELEQREKLIHIIVIVCAMVLAVPAGMFACTTNSRTNCFSCCTGMCGRIRWKERDEKENIRQGAFDSLQAASDEKLCQDSGDDRRTRRRSEDKTPKGNSAQLY